jgi:hypothetical protein
VNPETTVCYSDVWSLDTKGYSWRKLLGDNDNSNGEEDEDSRLKLDCGGSCPPADYGPKGESDFKRK